MKTKNKRLLTLMVVALLVLLNIPFIGFAGTWNGNYYDLKDDWPTDTSTFTYTAPAGMTIDYIQIHAGEGQLLYTFYLDDLGTAAPYKVVDFSSDRTSVTVTETANTETNSGTNHNVSFVILVYKPIVTETTTTTALTTTTTALTTTTTALTTTTTTPTSTTTTVPDTTTTVPDTTTTVPDTTTTVPDTTTTVPDTTTTVPETTTTTNQEETTTTTTATTTTERETRERTTTTTEPTTTTENITETTGPLAAPEILEDILPLAPVVLPKTGELPVSLFYGLGGLITAAGLFIKRR